MKELKAVGWRWKIRSSLAAGLGKTGNVNSGALHVPASKVPRNGGYLRLAVPTASSRCLAGTRSYNFKYRFKGSGNIQVPE